MGLLEEALQRPSPERESYLRSKCASDEDLYGEVMEALQWEELMGSFLCEPFLNLVAFAPPFESGQIVTDRFEIVREIGAGGMGVVYEAFDRRRQQRIAIKAAKPGFQRLLSPELEGALQVRHHNICLVNEIHATQTSAGEIDFLTMELLSGETLASHIAAGGKLCHEEALEIGVQLCAAVTEAHRSGVLHRDLKSSNVILCKEQNGGCRAVITDFGLASKLSSPTGDWGGTPGYMAPELWNGGQASKASDLYALGVIFYQMVTGVMPYAQPDAGDAPAGARAVSLPGQSIIDGTHSRAATVLPPAPSTRTRNLNPRWDRVIMGCLALAPEGRIQDAEEVRHELTDKHIRKTPFVAAALMIVVLAAIWWWRRPLPLRLRQVHHVAAYRDGQCIARRHLSRRQIPGLHRRRSREAKPLASANGYFQHRPVAWAGSGSRARIALHARWQLHLLLPIGFREWPRSLPHSDAWRRPERLRPEVFHDVFYQVGFSPDGKQLVFARRARAGNSLVIANIDGTNERTLLTFAATEVVAMPAWSPSGNQIAFLLDEKAEGEFNCLAVVPVSGGKERRILHNVYSMFGVAWLPDESGLRLRRLLGAPNPGSGSSPTRRGQ